MGSIANNPSLRNRYTLFVSVGLAIIVSIVLQYLWLFQSTDMSFYIWGFPIVPAFIVPAIFPVLILASKYSDKFIREIKTFGRLRYWIAAMLLPVVSCSVMILVYQTISGEQIETTREWNALAISTCIDVLVIFIWSLPILLSQEIAWRVFVGTANASANILTSIFSSILWLISNALIIISIYKSEGLRNTIAIACYLFSIGMFLFWLQNRGSFYLSSLALIIILLFSLLIFGCDNHTIIRIFFGSDIKTLDGLLTREGQAYSSSLFSGAGAFFVFSFLIYKLKSK